MTSEILQRLGYEVEEADQADNALKRLMREEPIDLLLSDIALPGGMSGIDLVERATDMLPGLKVLLMSGYSFDCSDPAESSSWPRIRKPFRAADLAQKLRQVLKAA